MCEHKVRSDFRVELGNIRAFKMLNGPIFYTYFSGSLWVFGVWFISVSEEKN